MTQGSAQLVINEILINATNANCDGSCMPNTGEWTELYNNSNSPINIGCYVLTDGDWSATIPPGTILQPYSVYTIGSVNSQIPNLNLNIATCNCVTGDMTNVVGVFTNGDEQVIIANPNGTILDGLYWGSGQFGAPFVTNSLLGCASTTIALSASNPNIQQITGTIVEAESIYLPCDGSGNLLNGTANPTPGQPNFSPIQTIDPNENISNVSCSGSGSIQLNPINGVGPYLYQWQGTLSSNTTNTATVSTAGNYSVVITDIGQCGAQQNFTFNVTSSSTSTITVTADNSTICIGGSAQLTASGGGNYTWSPALTLDATTGDIVNATPAANTTYTVNSNFNGCTASETITIQVDAMPTAVVSNDSPKCVGDNIQLTLNATNSTSTSWTGPNAFVSSANSPQLTSISSNMAGDYIVTLHNGTCTSTATTTVVVDSPVATSIDAAGPFCTGDPVYDLSSPDEPGTWTGNGITNASTGNFDPASVTLGLNTITFNSIAYCTSPSTIDLTVVAAGDATINPIAAQCDNGPNVTLTTLTPGGAWSGTGVNALGVVNPTTLAPGTYTAIYTLGGSCGDVDQINITIDAIPQPQFTWSDSSGCAPLTVDLSTSPSSNSNQWLLNGTPLNNTNNQFSYTFNQTVCTDITLIQTTPSGCVGSFTVPSAICVQEYADAQFTWSPEEPSLTQSLVLLANLSSNYTASHWDIEGTVYTTNNVMYQIDAVDSQIDACLIVTNPMGCSDSICQVIPVKNDFNVYVPNSFTPNDDGFNDGFGPVIFGLDMSTVIYEFQVYSRDGDCIFLSHDPKLKWNGDKEMGDYYVLQDSYTWQLKMVIPGLDDPIKYRGHVIMLR